MIHGVILAAGASQRMGEPKALLQIGQKTFLQHIVQLLHSARIQDITVVLGAQAEIIQPTLDWFQGNIVINSRWEDGQLSSLLTGIHASPFENVHGWMVCPVDHPLLSHPVLVELLQGFWTSNKNIILPTYGGRRGHPVIFGAGMIDALRRVSSRGGAKAIVHAMPEEVLEVPVDENGILCNIDTQEDYRDNVLKRFS